MVLGFRVWLILRFRVLGMMLHFLLQQEITYCGWSDPLLLGLRV